MRERFRGQLSSNTEYHFLVKGEPGPDEIDNLIALLEAQKGILVKADKTETKVLGQARGQTENR
jgi:hypothetical protein